MKVLKIFALILILLFTVISGWIYMSWMGMERTFLNHSYYRDIVSSEVIFPDMVDTVLHNVYFSEGCPCCAGNDEDMQLPPDMQEEALEEFNIITNAFHAAFPEEWLEEQYLLVVDDVLALVRGEQESVTVTIDLQDRKERFRDEIINQMEKHLSDEETGNIEATREELETLAGVLSEEMDLPEQIEVADITEHVLNPQAEQAIYNTQIFRQNFFLFYFAFVLFIALNFLLAGISGGLKWFGAAALIAGSTFLGGIYLFRIMVFEPLVTNFGLWIPIEPAVISSISTQTLHVMSVVPLVFVAFGLVSLVAGIVVAKKQKADTP